MSKKVFVLFLCLSTVLSARTPERHRTLTTEPDAVVSPLTIQKTLASILAPISPMVHANLLTGLGSTVATDLIDSAKKLIGSRYRRGSSGPKAFDCSGFTSFVFGQMGIQLKRSSREQNTQGERVASVADLLPGDLVFFGNNGRRGEAVNHVGIVTSVDSENGTFEFIHSSSSYGVRIDSYPKADYWNRHFLSGRRILGNEN
ncbi:MAG: C40 family peptidase [Bacteroidaceae bacterium]|nr:C40 family peptidase [Bacteroidaceae bacterium]